MPIKSVCICDSCSQVLDKPKDGFIIKGEIYESSTSPSKVELLGNSFPQRDDDGLIAYNEIKEHIVCKTCFNKILNIFSVLDR